MKLLLALGALAGCALCSETDSTILYMLGGEATTCLANQDSDAILYIYGGSKAHQFKTVAATESSDDETIAYIFGGDPCAQNTDVEDVAAFLYGGDHGTTTGPSTIDIDLANFILGVSAQPRAAMTHAPPAGASFIKDDVALLERNQVLEMLTEWLPSQSYAKADWMLDAVDMSDDHLAIYMLSGSIPEINYVHEISDVLFGGVPAAVSPASVQLPSDVDLVMAHRTAFEHGSRALDFVELVELAEAADSELAAFMLGGDNARAKDTTEDDIAKFILGGADSEQAERHLEDLVDESDSVSAVDIVSLVDHHDNKDALFHLGGDAAISLAPPAATNYAEDDVALFERVDAVDTELALFLSGSSMTVDGVAGPGAMEEDGITIDFLYDSHSSGSTAAAIRALYGGTHSAADEEAEAARFLFGASGNQPQVVATVSKDGYVTTDDELIAQIFGGDAPAWSADDDAILFVLGETTVVTPTTFSTDSLTPVERWTQPLAPRPYNGDESEDCSDHECISRTVQLMQAELGLSEADFKNSMIWGEDMISYCQWQMSDEPVVGVTTRIPALPSSYSIMRPPSLATCKQVLRPAPQVPMMKSG